MLDCIVSITLADGDIEDPEILSMADAHAEIMGHPPVPGDLRAAAQVRQDQANLAKRNGTEGPFEALLTNLRQELPTLDNNGREMILECAFRVACADGEFEVEEDEQLRMIAQALAINEGVLVLEIARFHRQTSSHSSLLE